jgi:hypothetical protein
MTATLSDHDLTVLVDAAASGAIDGQAAIYGSKPWAEYDAMSKNSVREAALPFIFHGTKALAELGYSKQRLIATVEEMESLLQGDANVVLLDEDGISLQNLAGGWQAATGSRRLMASDLAFHCHGPIFTVLHEQAVSA